MRHRLHRGVPAVNEDHERRAVPLLRPGHQPRERRRLELYRLLELFGVAVQRDAAELLGDLEREYARQHLVARDLLHLADAEGAVDGHDVGEDGQHDARGAVDGKSRGDPPRAVGDGEVVRHDVAHRPLRLVSGNGALPALGARLVSRAGARGGPRCRPCRAPGRGLRVGAAPAVCPEPLGGLHGVSEHAAPPADEDRLHHLRLVEVLAKLGEPPAPVAVPGRCLGKAVGPLHSRALVSSPP
mmetsp:Transcript_2487/g.5924  ORF Transcript_2487/g.5924 Transcript_2487/m.5924 type:complete len:242 (-) Transcript_2487:146-871(-)